MDENIKDLLPRSIFQSISSHLISSGHRAEEGFPSGEEDEDSLTGDLFRAIRRPWTKPVPINGTGWRWCVTTRKFRGRGELATESLIGADGIVQVEVDIVGGSVHRKGMLFQAKKRWKHRDQTLIEQVQEMEKIAPMGSAVFDYEPGEYRAAVGAIVLKSDGRPAQVRFRRLGEFLAHEFFECSVGRRDTYFDWDLKGLVLPAHTPGFIQLNPHFVAAIQVKGNR